MAEVYALAEEINAAAGRRQVDTVDIGGGLPVDPASEETAPTYAQYARLLAARVPGLFDGRYGLVTEFGRSLLARHGAVVARVEYTKHAGGRRIAVTHAGAQVAARTVYAPDAWPLRIAAYDAEGRPKTGPGAVQDIAGPACFAGDLLAEGARCPAGAGRLRGGAGHGGVLLRPPLRLQLPRPAGDLRLRPRRVRRHGLRDRAACPDRRRGGGRVRRSARVRAHHPPRPRSR
ncbi:hypothetical protein ACFQ3Z_19695 [Streptomyces nogalater]